MYKHLKLYLSAILATLVGVALGASASAAIASSRSPASELSMSATNITFEPTAAEVYASPTNRDRRFLKRIRDTDTTRPHPRESDGHRGRHGSRRP